MLDKPDSAKRLRDELHHFQQTWPGGYREGDVLDPLGSSTFGAIGFMSVLYATYLRCIKPYVSQETRVLEIGPGAGAWTKAFLVCGARDIWCLDALSREDNQFDRHVGPNSVHYLQVDDFSCRQLPDDHFDYMFSFGCFCHISPAGIREYMKSLYPKLKLDANGFIHIADYDQYNAAIADGRLRIGRLLKSTRRTPLRRLWSQIVDQIMRKRFYDKHWVLKDKAEDDTPRPGRFYHAGKAETSQMLRALGYEVLSEDVGTVYRDPIIHFRKR